MQELYPTKLDLPKSRVRGSGHPWSLSTFKRTRTQRLLSIANTSPASLKYVSIQYTCLTDPYSRLFSMGTAMVGLPGSMERSVSFPQQL